MFFVLYSSYMPYSPEVDRILVAMYSTEAERAEWPLNSFLNAQLYCLLEYLQTPTLEEGLTVINARRAIDVGVGADLVTVMRLARLRWQNRPLFTPDSLWAIDRRLCRNPAINQGFTLAQISAEEMRDRVEREEIPPFDLVLSRGVVSVGFLPFEDPKRGYQEGLQILGALRGCLNPANPDALLVISDVSKEYILPFVDRDLEPLGLEVVFSKPPLPDSTDQIWIGIFQRSQLFPPPPYDKFYTLAILKQRPSHMEAET